MRNRKEKLANAHRQLRTGFLLPLICAMLIALPSATLAAEHVVGKTDDGLLYTIANGEVTITGCEGTLQAVVIPEQIESSPVTAIGASAFSGKTSLARLKLPSALKTIGGQAFKGCTSLEAVLIPSGVIQIGSGAFWDCDAITSIVIPEGVSAIENFLFYSCDSLSEIQLPSRLTRIDSNTFTFCPSLTSLTLPRTCNAIGSYFMSCSANSTGITRLTLPASETAYDKLAFSGVRYLQDVLLPEDAAALPAAVKQIKTLQNVYTVSGDGTARFSDRDGVLYNAQGDTLLFFPCAHSSSYSIPQGVTTIAADAFISFATGTVTFPDSVVNIPNELAEQLSSGYVNVYENSPMHTYAADNEMSYTIISAQGTLTMEEKIDQVVSTVVTSGMDDYTKALKLHDWLVNNSIYDSTYTHRTAEDMLLLGTGVCEGYARAYQKLLDAVSIPCIYVNGYANAPEGQILHAWNLVKLNGSWYHVDATWDDPNPTPGGEHHDYFALSDYAISYDHAIDWIETPCTAYACHYGYREGKLDADLTLLRTGINSALTQGKTYFELELSGYKKPANLRTMELVLKNERFTVNGVEQKLNISADTTARKFIVTVGNLTGDAADYTYRIKNGEVLLTGYIGAKTALNMPSTILGMPVTGIVDNAFDGKPFTSVVLPDSITSIGISAFGNCRNLQSIVLPSGITRINGATFHACRSLTGIVISDSVTTIGEWAFYGCTRLASVSFPLKLQTIESDAFQSCEALKSVELPQGLRTINSYAFMGCHAVQSLIIPDSVTALGNAVFSTMRSLKQATLGKGITSIPEDTFDFCSALETVTLRGKVTSIGDRAFNECFKLQALILPKSTTSLGANAFRQCTALKEMILYSSVSSIGEAAFEDCSNLTLRVFAGSQALAYAKQNKLKYEIVTEFTPPASLTEIQKDAFRGTSFHMVDLRGTQVLSIGANAFSDCSKLTMIWIPKCTTQIDKTAFQNVEGLTILCYENSAAHQFAQNQGYRFELLVDGE